MNSEIEISDYLNQLLQEEWTIENHSIFSKKTQKEIQTFLILNENLLLPSRLPWLVLTILFTFLPHL